MGIILHNMPHTPTTRTDARDAWLRQTLGNTGFQREPASADASFRSYWRIEHDGQSLILMDAPPPHENVRPWLEIGTTLAQAGVHVPQVHAFDVDQGFALIEDFGNRLYLDALDNTSVDRLYGEALDTLLRMQTRIAGDTLPAYDADFVRRELELLTPWFLQCHLGYHVDTNTADLLDAAFQQLIANATEQPRCFVHRDFHSRNLMVTTTDNPGVIDFQGALLGPVTYDLASLLRDCYIAWDDARVEQWLQHHRERLIDRRLIPDDVDPERFRRWFDLTGLQRHIKVLGLFCRLAYRDQKPGYLEDLPRVLAYVMQASSRYQPLQPLARLLREATTGRDLRQPRSACQGDVPCAP